MLTLLCFLILISLLMRELVLANRMCFVVYSPGLNTYTLQAGENKITENASENSEMMLLVLILREKCCPL